VTKIAKSPGTAKANDGIWIRFRATWDGVGISVLLRPEIERDRGKFADKRADEPGVRSMDLM
jgi:hypothetical protein